MVAYTCRYSSGHLIPNSYQITIFLILVVNMFFLRMAFTEYGFLESPKIVPVEKFVMHEDMGGIMYSKKGWSYYIHS